MMERILKNQKVKGSLFISILFLVWCCPLCFWQCPAFADQKKEAEMLSPKETGTAWDLPAGAYGVDEQSEQGDSDLGPGETPTENRDYTDSPGGSHPTINRDYTPGPGGSPSLGR